MASTEPDAKTNIQQIVILTYNGGNTRKFFNLSCPFIPDVVEIQALMSANAAGTIAPVFGVANGWGAANLFSIQLSCLPQGFTVLASIVNTVSPVLAYLNTNRSTFQGSFSADIFNITGGLITDGVITLLFTFTRYKQTKALL